MTKKFSYDGLREICIVVLAGQEKDGTTIFLDSYGVDITPNFEDALQFKYTDEAREFYKNYVQPSILIGNSRLQLLDRVIEFPYRARMFDMTMLKTPKEV